MRLFFALALILPVIPAPAPAQDPGAAMKATVDAMCPLGNEGRRDHLRLELIKAGLKPERLDFAPESGKPGRNLVVTFGTEQPAIVISAHTDRIKISPGANDDASGCAVLLQIARDLAARRKSSKPQRMIVCAFLDRGASRSYGPYGLLAHYATTRFLACLDLDMVGVGDTVLHGPVAWPRADAAQLALTAALAGIPEKELPRRGLVKMPPSDVAAYRKHGLDAVTVSMAPSAEVDALEKYLGWRRQPGQRRPSRPRYLARARTPRDGAATVSAEALMRAHRVASAWLAEAEQRTEAGRTPDMDHGRRCRELRRLLATGDPSRLGGRTGTHVDLIAAVGPRGFFRTVVEALEADRDGRVEPVACKLLQTYVAGPRLVRPVSVLLEENAPHPLAEGLAELYRTHWADLTWDADTPAFRLMEKDVKGRTSDGR